VCGLVNRHNCYVQGSENAYEIFEHECDSPKVNMVCASMKNNIISLFFFKEPSVTGEIVLAIMEDTVLCYISAGTIFQLVSAPPHFSHHVCAFLDREFCNCWIGR
jgi:hypothetical protein